CTKVYYGTYGGFGYW
nr:immunoglobulin heavy chain junction region [Mus musculus]MBK4186036.1 immunoglobulin heavy chain junction region [Mus musculus]